jgi:hypothetical protein
MEYGQLTLEYLKVLLSWPVVLGSAVLYFLKHHRQMIDAILQRVSSVSVAGVEMKMPPYVPTPDPPSGPTALPQGSRVPDDQSKDLHEFLWGGLVLYKVLTEQDINLLWDRSMKGPAFVLTLQKGQLTDTGIKKLLAMKMDERAIRDYEIIGKLTKSSSLRDLMDAYHRSVGLHDYLSRRT